MEGWIKLHRKLINWQWVTSANHLALFVQLLLRANYKESKWRQETIGAGQILTGRKQLMDWTGLSEKQIRKCLDDLENSSEIVRKRASKYSIISITNWETYQDKGNDEGILEGNSQGQQRATSKKDKNIKKEKKYSKSGKKSLPIIICEASPLEFLFPNDEEIKEWLRSGSPQIQQRLLDEYDAEYLKRTIPDAFIYQLEKGGRAAGTFLSLNWIGRDNKAVRKADTSQEDAAREYFKSKFGHYPEEVESVLAQESQRVNA